MLITSKYATIKETATLYKSIYTETALRNLIANADKNGLKKCIRRIGRKIIINLEDFDKWIDNHSSNKLNKTE